jgi:transcriptional regulator GlxA family with amidase domain
MTDTPLKWHSQFDAAGFRHSAALRQTPAAGAARTAVAAVAAMRRQLSAPPTIPQLAAQLGVSERTLQSAFHEHFSTAPSAYFKRLRLAAVRDALRCASPGDTTVTRVAAEAGGFFHLGRFAGEYLAMFGEHPADTLRSAAPTEARPHDRKPAAAPG